MTPAYCIFFPVILRHRAGQYPYEKKRYPPSCAYMTLHPSTCVAVIDRGVLWIDIWTLWYHQDSNNVPKLDKRLFTATLGRSIIHWEMWFRMKPLTQQFFFTTSHSVHKQFYTFNTAKKPCHLPQGLCHFEIKIDKCSPHDSWCMWECIFCTLYCTLLIISLKCVTFYFYCLPDGLAVLMMFLVIISRMYTWFRKKNK